MAKEASQAIKLDVTRQQFNTPVPGIYMNDLTPASLYKPLVEQCRAEWEYCWRVQNGKTQKYLNRLRLYNNQKRNDDVVGDNTLFTIMNSFLSAIYDDELSPEWVGRNEGNEDLASNLNSLSSYDKEEMDLDQLRYYWWWDTGFFGKGFVGMTAFDRKKMCPVPELIDPMTFMQDTEAFTLNGDMLGHNAARFCGREILLTKYQMEKVPSVFDLDMIKIAKSTKSLIDQARQSRQDAQGLNQQIRTEEKDLGVNAYYQITEWMTHFKHPILTNNQTKKVLVWLANDRQKVIRFKILPQQDRWPIIERSLFPSAHDFYGTSITDLVEDKQRMRAILLNLGINLVKSDLFGMYMYDRATIKNRADLNFDFNKFIGVDLKPGQSLQNVVQPMARQNGNQGYFNMIMQILDLSAQKATATSDMQQGQVSAKKNALATEVRQAQQNTASRYSLAAQIASWSEKDFWNQYYYLYKRYFKAVIDEKVVRVQGVFAPAYPTFKRENIIGKTDPDVKIKSKFMVQAEQDKKRALMNDYAQLLLQDPNANKRYIIKRLGKLHNISIDELEQLLPPTPDERKAREENIILNKDKFVQVKASDNHIQHLEEHSKARRTKALYAHIATHEKALELQKTNPEMFQQQQGQQQGQGTPPQNQGLMGALQATQGNAQPPASQQNTMGMMQQ